MGEEMMESEIHTLIVWSKAAYQKDIIAEKVKEKFEVLTVLEFKWDKEDFLLNLMPFYAHSQQHLNFGAYKELLIGKIEHCGDGTFYLLVFKDNRPTYDFRKTSSGERKVNTNIFDLKAKLRLITDGGYKIHASDNTFESNKDLTVLLGKNTEDFLKEIEEYKQLLIITHNCLGVHGFKNIEELFYLLNNSIEYIVLRNFECLPHEYTLEGHGDIDLLVENLNYMVHLSQAKPVYPDNSFRVHYYLKIANEKIPFDFRFLGDDYYDFKWEHRILKNKRYFNDIIAVPDSENYFYALLYHAYVQKREIKEDYYPRLERLAAGIGIRYHREQTLHEVKELLDHFLDRRQYRFVVPHDPTVFYNSEFVALGQKLNNYGNLLSVQYAHLENNVLTTEVFYNVEKNRIFKICPDPIAANEVRGLQKLMLTGVAPKLLEQNRKLDISIIEMEFIKGIPLSKLFEDGSFWYLKNIKKLICDSIHILQVLVESNLQHRDIKPDNFLIYKSKKEYHLKIIDFGWAIDYNEIHPITPYYLGGAWAYGQSGSSDPYALGNTLKDVFGGLPSICSLLDDSLLKLTTVDNPSFAKELVPIQNYFSNLKLTPKEKLKLFFKRRPKLGLLTKKVFSRLLNLLR